jgi:C1A family cysteine protease
MSVVFILSLALLALVNSRVYSPMRGITKVQAFEEYNAFWNKTHKTEAEKHARYLNFLYNAKEIALANKQSKATGIANAATFGFTKFSDMSPREFQTKQTGLKLKNPKSKLVFKREEFQPGSNIDWVAAGKTTPVKNQEQCGSCWAFSATEEIESAILIAGGSPQIGAPQEIVDCDTNDQGCNGGDPAEAMQWIISQGGQDAESCYPYTAQDGTCASAQCTPVNKISSTQSIAQSEPAIYQALQGAPLSICCDASAWQNYNGGVLAGSSCGDNVDHAIQLTGYSTSQGGYWIVRNSWGADWGESGFIWLQYGQNTCDITSEVTLGVA